MCLGDSVLQRALVVGVGGEEGQAGVHAVLHLETHGAGEGEREGMRRMGLLRERGTCIQRACYQRQRESQLRYVHMCNRATRSLPVIR